MSMAQMIRIETLIYTCIEKWRLIAVINMVNYILLTFARYLF